MTESNQAKKVYIIMERGKREVKEKVSELMSEMENIICQVVLGLHNLHLFTKEEEQTVLSRYIRSIDEKIQCYRERETFLHACDCLVHRPALAKRRGFLLHAEREWALSFQENYYRENT
jgi:tRNA U38,U39,U40 pseudouridine synthase TruA